MPALLPAYRFASADRWSGREERAPPDRDSKLGMAAEERRAATRRATRSRCGRAAVAPPRSKPKGTLDIRTRSELGLPTTSEFLLCVGRDSTMVGATSVAAYSSQRTADRTALSNDDDDDADAAD